MGYPADARRAVPLCGEDGPAIRPPHTPPCSRLALADDGRCLGRGLRGG